MGNPISVEAKKSAGVAGAFCRAASLVECRFACLLLNDSLVSPRLLALRAARLVSKSSNIAGALSQCIGGFPAPDFGPSPDFAGVFGASHPPA